MKSGRTSSSRRQSGELLAKSAEDRLRREIVRGTVGPGERLTEASLAVRLGVSRVPVREALIALEREGLVQFSQTGRAFVRQLGPRDFEELFQVRLVIEPAAARLAARRLRDDVAALEKNVAATLRAGSVAEVTRLDLDFHELIVAASGNGRLLGMWKRLRGELELWLGALQAEYEAACHHTVIGTATTHAQLVAAVQTSTPAAFEQLIHGHIVGWRSSPLLAPEA